MFLKTNLWSLIHRGEFLQWRKLRATVLMLCLIPTCRLFIQELLVSVIFQAYELKHYESVHSGPYQGTADVRGTSKTKT